MKINGFFAAFLVVIIMLVIGFSGCSSDSLAGIGEDNHGPRELTSNEEDLVVSIALGSTEMEDFIRQDSTFKTELMWLAEISEESGSVVAWQINYQWQLDDQFNSVPETATWFPAVLIKFSEPEQQEILIAVDLNTEKVVYTRNRTFSSGVPSPAEDRLPDITGWITDIQTEGEGLPGQILVKAEEGDGTSNEYWVGIKQDTLINDYRRGTHDIMLFSGLETGQQVQVWFDGPIQESYPAQADARQIDLVLNEEFAIYFLEETIVPSEMLVLSQVQLPENPIISIADVISYSSMTHEIELTPEAYQRIKNMEVPRAFVVAVASQPVYWGTFWSSWFSRSIENCPVILKPLSEDRQVIQIDLGYPSWMDYGIDDPRSDLIIMNSLERTDKLSTVIGQSVPIKEVETAD